MAFFDWKDELSVEIGTFDQEHQKLMGLINTLHETISSRQPRERIGAALDELVSFTKAHFANEEEVLDCHCFEELFFHKAEHEALLKQILRYQRDFHEGRTPVTGALSDFLKKWLTNHIQGTDKRYSGFLKDKGVT